jgi:hypothetical protein
VTFAEITDVRAAYEGTIAEGAAETRVQHILAAVSARLRLLAPDLAVRAAKDSDVATLAKDVVVNAVINRIPGSTQQVRTESESAGPFSRSFTYTTDKSGMFSDEDLALLGVTTVSRSGTVGTIKLGRVDWCNQ